MTAVPSVRVTAITHRGVRRPHNEDTIAVGGWIGTGSMDAPYELTAPLDRPLMCLVADGMGGHAAGEVASRLTAEYIVEHAPKAGTEAALMECLNGANRTVHEAMKTSPERLGMGTTVAGMTLRGEGHLQFNVGDSRLYRYKGGFLRQLSIDDVGVPQTDRGAGGLRRSSGGLTQCLGGTSTLSTIAPHVSTEPTVVGWRYLLCSDGLTDMVPLDKIEALLAAEDGKAASSLLAEAIAAGGDDNISIIVVTTGAAA